MKNSTKNTLDKDLSINFNIAFLREKLLNRIVIIGLVVFCFATVSSIARVQSTGFQFIYLLNIISIAILIVFALLKDKIHYNIRLTTVMSLLVLTACAGFYTFGFTGYSVLLLLSAAILTAAFGSRFTAFMILGVSAVIILVFGLLFSKGIIHLSFDIESYLVSYIPWLNLFGGLVAIGSTIIIIITSLIKNLISFSVQCENNTLEIGKLNQTLEQKVESRNAELTQSNKDKDRILGIVAHDINNKLGAVIGYLDLLKLEEAIAEDQNLLQNVDIALDSSILASNIVQELLDFSRNQGDSQPIITEPVDIYSFIQSTVGCLLPIAMEKKIDLKIENVPAYTFCNINRTKLSRVIDNLLTNAIKFTNVGGAVTIDIDKRQNEIVIRVNDTGIGIPDDLKPNIFDVFSSSGRTGTAKEKSTGLGLSISKKIAEQHGGKIWVESEAGKGSTFFLQLPLAAKDISHENVGYVRQ